jgi:FAD-linked oxidoreductase
VLAAVREGPAPVRAVGAGHSFTALVPTSGTLVSLDGLAGIVEHDAGSMQATVLAGTRLGELGAALAAIGQCMPNLPDINKQSLGGAIATATHGSGVRSPALHAQVVGMRIATPAMGLVDCSRDAHPELFDAARVGLGAFGIVTRYRLQNVASLRLLKRVELRPTAEVLEDWPSLRERHRNAEFFALPFTGMSATVTHDVTDRPPGTAAASQDSSVLLDLKWLRDWAGFSSALRRRLAQMAMAQLKPEESIEEAWKVLSNERDVRFNEMEYHLPREAQVAALREILDAIERYRPDVFFPIEVRSIAPDDAWLSPFHDRESGSLAVHAYYKDDYRFLFDLIEPILRKHGGRPHWGKLHSLTARELAPMYPRWRDAMAVRQAVDPEGRLMNPFLKRLFVDG